MKKVYKILFAVTFVFGFILVNNSCTKSKLNRDTTSSEDNSKAEALYNDVFNEIDKNASTHTDGKTASNTSYAKAAADSCATITVVTTNGSFPKTMTIDYGTTYCTGPDGKERKGKIIAELSGKYREAGTTVTVTTDNYYIDEYKVEGTKIVKNITNTGGNPTYTVSIAGTITTPDGESITWNSNRQREWVEGSDTWLWAYNDSLQKWVWMGLDGIYDDVWEITGSGDGIDRNGTTFTVNITTPLRVQWCQPYIEITEGIIELQPEGLKLRTLDYGDKSCDNEGVVKIDKKEYTFKFRK